MTKTLLITNRKDWRKWLEKNHSLEKEIWLIYYKKHTGKPRISYDDAVEEALCFGWIDSIIKRIDNEKYAQKFTPRKDWRKWSPSNIRRIKHLIQNGLMTEVGRARIDASVLEKRPGKKVQLYKTVLDIPPELITALKTNHAAWDYFNSLAPSYQRQYILWITTAKREETKQRRLAEALEMLARNEKLGMK